MLVRWNERPSPSPQILCGWMPVMSRPSSTTLPLSGGRWPVIRLNRVDLPAPLGPITAAICCVSTRRLTSETARKPAKDFEMPLSSSNALAPRGRIGRGAAFAMTVVEPLPQTVERADNAAGKTEQQHDQDRAEH